MSNSSRAHRIHVFGASAAGTSTLGRDLAERLRGRHLDADDYYWIRTDPPFRDKREPGERISRIERDVAGASDWVLSGSICSWGDPLLERFTLAVFLRLDPRIRMERLLRRERDRHGARIEPGGDMHAQHLEFVDWARRYDEGRAPLRSLDLHERWMERLTCPVLRLDSARPVDELSDEVISRISEQSPGASVER